jgi:NADH-quinone oxidoreductase subunit C
MELSLSNTLQETFDGLKETFGDDIRNLYQLSGDAHVHVFPDRIVEIAKYLHDERRFIMLSDVIGTDRYTNEDRFEVIYNLMSLRDRDRLFVRTWLPEEEPEIDSVTSVWKSASWYEREVYDMFGIRFRNHPDLRRMYMPEDYQYFPLRKEFPLLGIPGSIDLPNTTPDND